MGRYTDRGYLRGQQYKDDSKLNARIQLHERYSTNPQPLMRWLLDRIALPPQARVLDIGCGPGNLWCENCEALPEGTAIVLGDFSMGMLRTAQQRCPDSSRFSLGQSDVMALPFKDDSFDIVIANFMLYHVPDRELAFSETRRVLVPGGKFFAATNGANHMRRVREIIRRFDADAATINVSGVFGLENGAAQLEHEFEDVRLILREDDLNVTEIEPLLAYMLSTGRSHRLEANPDALRAYLEDILAEDGVIHIEKEVGLFAARKPA